MHKWEYYIFEQKRQVQGSNFGTGYPSKWNNNIDLAKPFAELGNEGWELVSVVPGSDFTGMPNAGVTTSLLWVFKRPLN